MSIRRLSLSYLFSDEVKLYSSKKTGFFLAIAAIPAFFYVMAIWLSNSIKIGSTFTGLFFLFVLLTFGVGWVLLQLLALRAPKLRFPTAFVVQSLLHYRVATLFYFAAVSLSVMLITLVLQVERTIQDEAGVPKDYKVPTLFFFNIVEETVEDFTNKAIEMENPIRDIAPMLSGRLTHINHAPIQNTLGDNSREEDFQQSMRENANRRVNLSFREGILGTESLDAGVPFSQEPLSENDPIQISLEQDFAEDLGIALNDTINISLIDIPFTFEGKVVNLRRVKWNTFQPNFFIVVQPGVLEQFPKTYVATLSLDEGDAEKVRLQTVFSRTFPNISVIDTEKIVKQVLAIVNKLVALVKGLAFFSLALGVFLLFSVVNHQVYERRKEINMLKVIGSKLSRIKLLVLGEYFFIGIVSIFLGITTSLLLYYLVVLFIFEESRFTFHPTLFINISAVVLLIIMVVSFLAASNTLRQKPITLLKSSD